MQLSGLMNVSTNIIVLFWGFHIFNFLSAIDFEMSTDVEDISVRRPMLRLSAQHNTYDYQNM